MLQEISDDARNEEIFFYNLEIFFYYLEIVINYLDKKAGVKVEEYLDSQDLDNYQQIQTIIVNAMKHQDEENGIYRLNDVRRFLKNTADYYTRERNPIANYIYSILNDIEPDTFSQKFNYINEAEMEGVDIVGKKHKLPREMKEEISSFIGSRVGGRKRKTQRRKKRKTKRRQTKKYRK